MWPLLSLGTILAREKSPLHCHHGKGGMRMLESESIAIVVREYTTNATEPQSMSEHVNNTKKPEEHESITLMSWR